MGKISPVSAKYIVHTQIQIEGVVDKPDVVGAIFGQTEGLLGSDLELRELQRSGRIGRIEVKLDTKSGKTTGGIIIPSSMDKVETAIIGAAMETIQKIGPCNARVKVEKVEDVRVSKRSYVLERAKEILKEMTDNILPDSQEIAEEVAASVRMQEIREYGRDRLPAGPAIDDSEEIIVTEGRADVLNLLKNGFKNVIGMSGTNVPETIIELSKGKTLTVFVDGDRGGELILKELMGRCEIDFVAKAPDGKEVEEITKKEIHKALRSKITVEQYRLEVSRHEERNGHNGHQEYRERRPMQVQERPLERVPERRPIPIQSRAPIPRKRVSAEQAKSFRSMLDDLVGTKGAYILDENSNILGKVPVSELDATLKSLSGVYAVVVDGEITRDLASAAEMSRVKYLVATNSRVKPNETRVEVLTGNEL
ncbi:DNA primase [Candidatus Woesearchaeota archaeon]|nr:DNA primase [Candidatus Woesearchaeota archaeon]